MTIFSMTTDDAVESEISEPNSLREVLLFCAVLVVEVYSLAVAFGGPFFEVGYFLLVVISQTTAGAYIWAQLRRIDKSLPLPELLAMGFAIGSASAAISQLIIRDLFGIRIFLSPLVPIISVAIWLIAKRNTRLPVTITHANTNTLIWLLFPAPLAISFFVWELYAFFVIPLIILVLLFHKRSVFNYLFLILFVTLFSHFFALIIRAANTVSVAIGLIGDDEIFDEAMAIGFSNWGIGDHIGRVGDSFAYYKLSHVWLGPIIEITNAPPMIMTTSVLPLTVFTFIGMALWGLSYQIFRTNIAAGIAAILFFIQSAFPEPEYLAIRVAQCLVIVYFLSAITALMKKWTTDLMEALVASLFIFVIAGTRAQYGLFVLIGLAIYKVVHLIQRKASLKNCFIHALLIIMSLTLSFVTFFNLTAPQSNSAINDSLPRLAVLLVSYVGLRSLIPLVMAHENVTEQYKLILSVISAAILAFFVVPQSTLANAPSLTIALLVTVVVSKKISLLPEALTKMQLIVGLLTSVSAGVVLRIFYDAYKWMDLTDLNRFVLFFAKIIVDGRFVAFVSVVPFVFLVLLISKSFMLLKEDFSMRSVIFASALGMSFGLSVAVTFRHITNNLRYVDIELGRKIYPESPNAWYTDSERIAAINWLKTNSNRDDIFAQNTSTPDYRSTEYSASLILSSSSHRRAYIEGTYSPELQIAYSRDTNLQSPRLRDQLLRLNTSYYFPITPSQKYLETMQAQNVRWFVVDLGNTPLRDWEPWATTRFMNEKVAILELAQLPAPSN